MRQPAMERQEAQVEQAAELKTWQCRNCGYIYREAEGDADGLLPAGTRWADVPDDWSCPQCGTPKSDFDIIEI
jgi:rubredoxin